MKRVFVSGCYDLLHAGHLQFFREARELGDHLTVSFASEKILRKHKGRKPSLPDAHKKALLQALPMIDEVVSCEGEKLGLDFEPIFRELKPDLLVVTEDDRYSELKQALCDEVGCQFVKLPKSPPAIEPISTTDIVNRITARESAPLRVDFAGGWLDVPKHAREGAFIVNCAISPMVSLNDWPYHKNAGLGGSGAWALLNGKDSVQAELDLGVGWQDPAIIHETGVCVWLSGARPELAFKNGGQFLRGCMALKWSGQEHDTPGSVDIKRDYDLIAEASHVAAQAVRESSIALLAEAVKMSYRVQVGEGMEALPDIPGSIAQKYCGGGHGGYVLVLFPSEEKRRTALEQSELHEIEPYLKSAP
ncbi:MAG: adenylyltransferase/cytidyltransferase family protein [Akkermansiaceae bacterium]